MNFGLNHVATAETTTVEKKFSKQIQRPVPVQQEPTPTQTIIAPIPKTKESTQVKRKKLLITILESLCV